MNIEAVYINCYKYDFDFAKICIASIRYWYPDIPIFLIKDVGSGNFDTSIVEDRWNIKVFNTARKKFGWGFGKWEPLFLNQNSSFLTLDADTAMLGPILEIAQRCRTNFLVDEEVQPLNKLNEIYYRLDYINEVNPQFVYPGYTFNEGQWFGTSGIINRNDFDSILNWTEPPSPKFPHIIKQGAQGHLNYLLQFKQQIGKISIARKKIMIWPNKNNADFIDLDKIISKSDCYPYIMHWAGFTFNNYSQLPRYDILKFYQKYYYTRFNLLEKIKDRFLFFFLTKEKRIKKIFKRILNRIKKQ